MRIARVTDRVEDIPSSLLALTNIVDEGLYLTLSHLSLRVMDLFKLFLCLMANARPGAPAFALGWTFLAMR